MAEFQSKFTGQEVDNAIDKLRNWIGVDGTYPTVTISGVTYAVIWKSIPVSGTPCYGIGLHPTTGRIYEIYYNGSSYTATALDTDTKNTAGSTNSTSKLFLVGAGSQAANPQTFSNGQVYTTDGTLYATTFYENGTALSSKYQAKGNYLPLSGGSLTGDLALYTASGDSPRLTFQRGASDDALNDWSLYEGTSGRLYIQQRGHGSTDWETKATFSQDGVNFAGAISENGTSLSSKYLGKTAKAADADKLDGNDSTYYLNYNNLTNKPTLGTAASKNTGTSSGNIPVLDNSGKLAESVIPAVAITDTYVVATETAMLALNAQKGDIAIRSDLNKSFVLQATPASTLANWKELLTPTDAVLSVNGKTGAVTLNLDNISDGSTRKLADYVPKSLTSAKGDMIYASDANTPARLAIGSNGQFLSIANGVPKWVNNPNTNTWRKIQLNGTDKLGTGTNTNPLNIKAGNNMTITESNGTFTFAATDTNTDTKVTAVGNHYTPANGTNLTVSSSGTASRGSTKVLTNIAIDAAGHITGGTWYTLPGSDNTDTHYTNYLQIKGNGTEAVKFEQNANKTLNLKPGTNVSISAASGEITISATDTTYSAATQSAPGLMSANDKKKLDGIAAEATKVTTDTVSGWGYTKNKGTVTSVATSGTGISGGTITSTGTITLDSSSAGNATANKVVIRNAAGSIQTEKLAVSSGATTKATMQYNSTEDCIEFIFA